VRASLSSSFAELESRGRQRDSAEPAGACDPGFDGSLTAFGDPDGSLEVAVIEHLRVRVRADARSAWLQAETHTWEPWLRRQRGFLGRELFWDADREEGILLIRWASREQWKAIRDEEVDAVQRQFEALAHLLLAGSKIAAGEFPDSQKPPTPPPSNPFPLVHAGELEPRALAAA
jgi:uncharacterized protein (TIGR03792 family)